MKKTALSITPFGGYDIPGLEGWLSAKAAKGFRFTDAAGPLTVFTRTEPEPVQVHLEPIRGAVQEDPEANAIYQESGWQYWGMFRSSFYVYASTDLDARAHTDPEVWDDALKTFFRQKVITGILLLWANVLLLGLYRQGISWEWDFTWLRWFPVETLSNGTIIPFLLALAGFFLIDLAYLLGLIHLARYRRAVRNGSKTRSRRGVGWLMAAGLLILLPVLVNTAQLYFGMDYRPYPLEGSGFVTLTDIEGEDFSLSGDPMYNMDRIDYGGTLLRPERWYFQQYASFPQYGDVDLNAVPRLELTAVRYPMAVLAEMRAEEWSRQRKNGSLDFEILAPDHGLDEIFYAPRKGGSAVTASGATREFLPGGVLILRRGNTVLHVNYYGHQDLTEHLESFAHMLEGL